jgi:alkylhydroperoxidase family enzyme
MTKPNSLDTGEFALRSELERELKRAWERLAAPGTWWSGQERLAIAAEVRGAHQCSLCQQRKQALSPYAVKGQHDTAGVLSEPIVEVIHRVTTDAGRLTKKWLQAMLGQGVSEEQYVEAIGVIAVITALDTFDLSLGLPQRPLPEALPGAPTRLRPKNARQSLAWVSTVEPDQLAPGEIDPYAIHGTKNIHRALSLVPQEVLNFFDLDVELYLKDHEIRDFNREYRALSHVQMELLAGRVSAVNGCYY